MCACGTATTADFFFGYTWYSFSVHTVYSNSSAQIQPRKHVLFIEHAGYVQYGSHTGKLMI